MKVILKLIPFLLFATSYGQNDTLGLFGDCRNNWSHGYTCQQMLLLNNGTCKFYDSWHLRGWGVTEGTWNKSGDTIILNSPDIPYKVTYQGNSTQDSIEITFKVEGDPMAYGYVWYNSHQIELGISGILKIPREPIDTLIAYYFDVYESLIHIDNEKLMKANSIEIKMAQGFSGKYYFQNEKWLLKDDKLYHTASKEGIFYTDAYFIKVSTAELWYEIEKSAENER